jgi:polysaccharide deacetylase family protein (PEP-CTERM system associated)
MQNILAFDLEDWHSLVVRRYGGRLPSPSYHIDKQTDVLLNLLNSSGTKATFFITGVLAEPRSDLVKKIASEGHEIASHGYIHLPIYRMSPEEFKQDTLRSKKLLEDLIGKRVDGYRACEFSIIKSTLWALNILADLGFTYDSSIYPIKHRRYGIPGFSREITRYHLGNDRTIIELPLSTYHWAKINWPMAGGGYFRLIPLKILFHLMKQLNNDRMPVITYFHPYEFDPEGLNSFELFQPDDFKGVVRGWIGNVHQNIGRSSIYRKIRYITNNLKFTTISDYLNHNKKIIKEAGLIN